MRNNNSRYATQRFNRRQMLQFMGVGAAGLALAGCLPPPQATQSTGSGGEAAAAVGDLSKWRLGKVDPNWNGTFKAFSWEDEGEMRKWQYHIGNFFKANYPKAKPEITWGVPWAEYWTKLPTAITGGDPPDLAWMHDTRVHAFAARDLLLPLDDFISANKPVDWPDAFYKSQVQAFQHDGKQYAIPYDWAPGGLYVNKTLLTDAGQKAPTENTTLDEFVEIAKAVSKPDKNVYGVNLPYGWPAGLYWVFRSFGADFFAADLTKGLFDTEEAIAAIQWLADLRFKHNVAIRPENLQGIDNPFSQGLVAMNWSLNDEAFKQGDLINKKFEWDVAPSPTGPKGRFQFVGGSGWSIPKGAKNPDLAWELTRYVLSDPEVLPISAKMGSQFVSRADMWEHAFDGAQDVGFSKDSYKHAFYDLGQKDGVVPPYHPKYSQWESLWSKHLDPVFIGEQKDVAAACKALNEDTNKLLQEKG
ncbi:MAG: extracellular solute-binding protein [Caldilineaceae bacterium]